MGNNAFNIAMVMRADVSGAKAGVTDLTTAMRGFEAASAKAGSNSKLNAQELERMAAATAKAAIGQNQLVAAEHRAAEARAKAASVPLAVFAGSGSGHQPSAIIGTIVADMTKGAASAAAAWRGAETAVGSLQGAVAGLNSTTGSQAHGMLEVTEAARREKIALDDLRASFNPLFAASRQYAMELERIDLALEANIISEREAMAARAAAAARMAPSPAGGTGSATGPNSFYTGNVAAQGFDIGVTAAMGMNPAMIGLQQGSQLVQVMQQMGGGTGAIKGIAAGLLSILNPLSLATMGFVALGAVGIQALMSLWPTSKSTREVIDELAASVGRVSEATKDARRSMLDLGKEFGSSAEDAEKLLGLMTEIELRAAKRSTDKALKNIASELGGGWDTYGYTAGSAAYLARMFAEGGAAAQLVPTPGNAPKSFDVLGRIDELKVAQKDGSLDDQIAAAEALQKAVQAAAEASGKITEEEDKWLGQIGEVIRGLMRIKALKENAAGKAEAEEIKRTLEEQIVLERASLQYGADSEELAAIRAGYEMEALQRKLAALGLTEDEVRASGVLNALFERQAAQEEALLASRKEQALVRQDAINALTRELSLLGASSAAQIRANALAEAEIEIRKELLGIDEARQRRSEALAKAEAEIALQRGRAMRDAESGRLMDQFALRSGLARDPRLQADIAYEEEYIRQIRGGADADVARAEATNVRTRALNDLIIAQDRHLQGQGQQIQQQQLELALIGQTAEVRARVLALMQAERDIQEIGASGEVADGMRRNALVQAELAQTIEAQAQAWQRVQSAGEAAIDGVLDKLRKGDAKGAMAELLGEIEKGFFDLAIRNPLKNAIFGTNLGTWDEVGGWGGIWGRLSGQNKVDEAGLARSAATPIQSMMVTAANVTLSGNLSGIGVGQPISNTNAAPMRFAGGLSGSAEVQSQVWQFFAGKGLAPHQIAGVMGNVSAESGFNPLAQGDNGQAFGLFQHNDRKGKLFDFIGGPQNLGNVQKQLEFAWQELMTTESGPMRKLMASTDVRGATEAFVGFERPSGYSAANPSGSMHFDRRLAAAEQAAAQFSNSVMAAGAQVDQGGAKAAAGLAQAGKGAAVASQGLGLVGQLVAGIGGIVGGKVGGAMNLALGIGSQLAAGVPLFKSGGFTGGSDPDRAAGIVHEGEFVFDAAATRRIGIRNLEGIRKGSMRGFRSGGYVSASPIAGAANTSSAPISTQPQPMHFSIDVSGARGDREIEALVNQAVSNGVSQGLAFYDREALPARIRQLNNDPWGE